MHAFFEDNFDSNKNLLDVYLKVKKNYYDLSTIIGRENWNKHDFGSHGANLFYTEYETSVKLMNLKKRYYKDLKKILGEQGFKKMLRYIKTQNKISLERARQGLEHLNGLEI